MWAWLRSIYWQRRKMIALRRQAECVQMAEMYTAFARQHQTRAKEYEVRELRASMHQCFPDQKC